MKDKQIKIGGILSYVQLFVNMVVGLAYTPVMIRLLGKSEYGLYNTVASVISMIAVLSHAFTSGYLFYYTSYKKKEDEDAIAKLNGTFLLIFAILGAIALACSLFLTFRLDLVFDEGLTEEEYGIARVLMLLLSANLALSFPMSVFSNIITAQERFVFLKLLSILRVIAGPLVSLPLLLAGYGSIAMVSVTVGVSFAIDATFLFYVLFVLKQRFVFRDMDRKLFTGLFVYSAYVAIHLIVDQVNWNVDKMLLGRFKGTEVVAVYSVGYTLYYQFVGLGSPIAALFAPRVHRAIEETSLDPALRRERLTSLFTKVGRIQFYIVALVASGVVVFGRPFIGFWVGEGYEESYAVALLLILPGTIDLMQNIGIEIQRAENLHRFRAYAYAAMALVNVALSIYLCQKYGAVGSAFGTALSLLLVQGLTVNIYYHKRCSINVLVFWKNFFRQLVGLIPPALAGAALMIFAPQPSLPLLLLEIVGYTALYFLSMWLLSMNREEKDLVLGFFRKEKKGAAV